MANNFDDATVAISNNSLTDIVTASSKSLVIAGTLMAQAVRIYKSVLEPEEVEKLLTHIVDNQDTIEPFKTRQLH